MAIILAAVDLDELTADERNEVLDHLGIERDLAPRQLLRRLYPFVTGVEKASDEQVAVLVTGELRRQHGRMRDRERMRRRLRRYWPVLVLLGILALMGFVLVLYPSLLGSRNT